MKHSKTSLFLMELILAILFFALASAICIRMFVKSHLISRESEAQNHAIVLAENLAESWYATNGDFNAMQQLFPNGNYEEDTNRLCFYYDKNWSPVSSDNEMAYKCIMYQLTPGAVPGEVASMDSISDDSSSRSTDNIAPETIYARIQISTASSPYSSADEIYALDIKHHIPLQKGNSL